MDSDMSGIIGLYAKVLLADGTHEFFFTSVTDHVYFQRARATPIGTTDVTFVPLFAGIGF